MNKLGLIFTNDWELYGNGTGDFFDLQYLPLKAMLNVFEEFGAKLTVMAEIAQHWAHKNNIKIEKSQEIVRHWELILKETIQRGHDVQLHLHPQWLDAKYINNKWNLNFNKLNVSSLTEYELDEVLRNGKSYLEQLLIPHNKEYRCMAFRAGAYAVNSSETFIKCLINNNFYCDTSVVKGLKNRKVNNYRDAYSNFLPWNTTTTDLKCRAENKNGIIEFPICSKLGFDSPILRNYYSPKLFFFLRFGIKINQKSNIWLKANRMGTRKYCSIKKNSHNMFLSLILSKLINRNSIRLDYDHLPPEIFTNVLKGILKDKTLSNNSNKDLIIPIVSVGHTKNMFNTDNIINILKVIKKEFKDQIKFWTLSEGINYFKQNREKFTDFYKRLMNGKHN